MNANSTRRQEKKPSHSIKATDDYSLGNVLYLLEDFAQSGGETLRNFTFAVQTFYSIMLNKWFCNHIKNQKNETSDFKKTDIVDFVGNLYTQYFIRAVPDIDKSDDGLSIDYRVRVKPEVFAHKFFNKTNPEHLSNSFISAFFGNVPIKIKSSEYYNYTFNMATFIQRFLEPQAYITEFANWNSTINAVNVGENNSDRKNETNLDFFDADEMKGIRIFCFILTTNLDIASALLRTRIRTVRTPPSAECLKRVVENLQKEVHTWAYLPIWHYDLDILIATFDSAQGFIDYIFNLQPYENNDKSKLRNSVGLLFNVAPDIDMESLVSKIDIITNVMYSIQDNFPVIDLTLEINELERILENAEKARKLNRPWSAKTCDTYRQTLNRMSNSAKAKGERFLND